MVEIDSHQPRWGNQCRDQKAAAILQTLQRVCGHGVERGRWLDVGCGSGGIARALADEVEHIDGVDQEPWELWSEFASECQNLAFHVAHCDLAQPPMPLESYDVIVCNQVYEHVANPEQLIRNIHAMLKPGGYCYFAGPNLLWPIEPHVFWPFVHWFPRQFSLSMMRLVGARNLDRFDAWSWSYWRMVKAFRKAELHYQSAITSRLASRNGFRHSWAACIASHFPHGLIESMAPFSPGFIFVLFKPLERN